MKVLKISLLLLSMVMPLTTQGQNKIFPFKYYSDDLPNGLRLVTVPTDFPNIVALYIVVNTGSRNEVEQGKSGFAHLFKTTMGVSPLQFLKQMRLEHARKALLGGSNVSEAANSVGYASLSHFISEFRRHFGESPKAYAQRLRDLHLAANNDTSKT